MLLSVPSSSFHFSPCHVTFDEATLYDPPSTVPQCQREVPHMLPTLTDSASFAPEITIRPIPTAGASSSSPITAIEDKSPSSHPAAPPNARTR